MHKAFLFGKFYPFHKGHEAMIRFALTQCDRLTVLVCCSDRETIPDSVRVSWITKTFAGEENLEVRAFNYKESDFPNTSVSSEAVSAVWSEVFLQLFPDYEAVITSEPYGDFVAQYMGIRHIPFDMAKTIVPISASKIKQDIQKNWNYLPDAVKPHFVKKIVVLGTESTGKTTLTAQLAAYFKGTAVLEAARDIIDDSRKFEFEDLYTVADEHARRIDAAVAGKNPVVFIDTDIYTTMSYGIHFFNRQPDFPQAFFETGKAGLYLYLNADVPHVQDGTRLEESDRNALDVSHRRVLATHHVDYVDITGSFEERLAMAVAAVERYLLTE